MIRSFQGFRPSPRFDSIPWNRVRIQESALAAGPWVTIDTQVLSPIDPNPASPLSRNFTTDDATLAAGFYRIYFLDASNNEDEKVVVEYPGNGYPAPAELVADSSIDALTTLPYEDQEVLFFSAKFAIEEYTGQTFGFTPDETRVLDGPGGRRIRLPWRLETLAALTVSGSALTAADVSLSAEHDALVVRAEAGVQNYYQRAMMEVQGWPSVGFTAGYSTVSITGDWGWETFPEPVREALRIDMEDQALGDTNALGESLRAFRALGLRNVQQGNLTAQVLATNALSDRVVRLLAPYTWTGQVGVTI